MKKLIILGIVVAIFAACGGSSSVDKAISRVEKAIEKVDNNKRKMTDDDWRSLEKELEEPLKVISAALDNDKVGLMVKMKIIAVSTKWAAIITQAGLGEVEKRMVEAGKEFEKAQQELEDSGALKDLEKAIQELGKENGDLAKQLQEAVKELEKTQTQ
jgi:prefoldin subunit 5